MSLVEEVTYRRSPERMIPGGPRASPGDRRRAGASSGSRHSQPDRQRPGPPFTAFSDGEQTSAQTPDSAGLMSRSSTSTQRPGATLRACSHGPVPTAACGRSSSRPTRSRSPAASRCGTPKRPGSSSCGRTASNDRSRSAVSEPRVIQDLPITIHQHPGANRGPDPFHHEPPPLESSGRTAGCAHWQKREFVRLGCDLQR